VSVYEFIVPSSVKPIQTSAASSS